MSEDCEFTPRIGKITQNLIAFCHPCWYITRLPACLLVNPPYRPTHRWGEDSNARIRRDAETYLRGLGSPIANAWGSEGLRRARQRVLAYEHSGAGCFHPNGRRSESTNRSPSDGC